MTLYHFGNCIALIYTPYHMVYKYSGIAEYGAFSKCIQAGGIYIFTQLCKMLVLATFFPDTEAGAASGHYDVLLELLKSIIEAGEMVGLYCAINMAPGKGHSKILTAALGWAVAEVLVWRTVSLWVGARGSEFEWRHMQGALLANVFLVQHIATATLLWLHTRTDLPPKCSILVYVLLIWAGIRAGALERLWGGVGSGWGALGLRGGDAAISAFAALALYATIPSH